AFSPSWCYPIFPCSSSSPCLRANFLLQFFFQVCALPRALHSFPTRRSSDLLEIILNNNVLFLLNSSLQLDPKTHCLQVGSRISRSEEHTSELQSRENLVCRLLLEKKKQLKSKHLDSIVPITKSKK